MLLSSEAVADADAWLPRWLEEQRTPFLNDVSYVTSHIADRWVLIPLVGIVVLSLAGSAGGWAASTFRRSSPRYSPTGSTSSSSASPGAGRAARHVQPASQLPLRARGGVRRDLRFAGAAARDTRFKDIRARVAIWTVAAGFPLVVASSRIYRGEHHPIDVVAGALMGAGAICVAIFAARTARGVAELRHEKHAAQRAADAAAVGPVESPDEVPA